MSAATFKNVPPLSVSEPSVLHSFADLLLDQAQSSGIVLRLCGGLGCWYRSQDGRRLAAHSGRIYGDIDFAAYYPQRRDLLELLATHGCEEDAVSATVPGLRRTIFRRKMSSIKGDIFYDVLSFCHSIDLRGRLELNDRTIPLADLLLQKLQIISLTEKDVLDVQMLLLDHNFTSHDNEGINAKRIAQVCSADWGFFRTLGLNLQRIAVITSDSSHLDSARRQRIIDQLEGLRQCVEGAPKSLGWRLRSVIGDRIRWYDTVDEH
jgi:hypothetical protein